MLVAEATLAALRAHSWPGNVRELKNVLACALAFVEPGRPSRATSGSSRRRPRMPRSIACRSAGTRSSSLERAAIRQTLINVRGNKVAAAKVLGIAPSTLYEKLKKYEI